MYMNGLEGEAKELAEVFADWNTLEELSAPWEEEVLNDYAATYNLTVDEVKEAIQAAIDHKQKG